VGARDWAKIKNKKNKTNTKNIKKLMVDPSKKQTELETTFSPYYNNNNGKNCNQWQQ